MDDQTACSNHREQNKPDWEDACGCMMNNQSKEINADQRRELGFASVALTEPVGDFDDIQIAAC